MLPYGEARAVIVGNAWYYAACDALSAAGSIKTYTSNKVCLWKQKPSNIARFGATGKTLKLDRQSVYCMQLDGISKLLQDKNLADFVHFFQEHEVLNPVEAFVNNSRYYRPIISPARFPMMHCPQYPPQYVHPTCGGNWQLPPPRLEARVEYIPPKPEIEYQPDPSHNWTAFNPVTGAHLPTPLCGRCGTLQNNAAAATVCFVATSPNTAAGKQQEAQAVIQNMKVKFEGLMGELQTHFIGLEKSFTELVVDMRAQFAGMENRLADITKSNKRRLEAGPPNRLTCKLPVHVSVEQTKKRIRC